MKNRDRYFETDGSVRPEAIRTQPWLRLLCEADTMYWNAERLSSMKEKTQNSALEYVLRTLDILDGMENVPKDIYRTVRTVLCWSETAKGGTREERRRWRKRGYPLEIHNEASAMIYADWNFVRDPDTDPVCILIRTHGLAGQFIRGECRMASSRDLSRIAETMSEDDFCTLIVTLNECIIRGVSEEIWEKVRPAAVRFAGWVYAGIFKEYFPLERLHKLLPSCGEPDPEDLQVFAREVFPNYDLWYFESALSPFGIHGAAAICRKAMEAAEDGVRHLNFKPLADTLYYDNNGKSRVNAYKQRILERWLEDAETYSGHVSLEFTCQVPFVLIGARFTPVCEKLIEFCTEAENSGLLSYEKSITMLYDMFGFRRDAFDRLNNEEKYLQTMNEADTSTKITIPDYVKGEILLDVGSGGGVLLDELEKRFPDRTVIGTDISRNVIETLQQKKKKEHHRWNVQIHNFVDGPFEPPVDTVIFSSILHEIYSYTETENGYFDIRSVEKALTNAAHSLRPGGRIVIRDGVRTPGNGRLELHFRTAEGMEFFRRFSEDFHGMDDMPYEQRICRISRETNTVVTDINYGREFLYTYTWGADSFAHECQECFGYYCTEDFVRLFASLGMKTVKAVSLLEPGYPEHLSPLVELKDPETGLPCPFPDSNCIIVAEKPL